MTADQFALCDVAVKLAGIGMHVFPLKPGSKEPATQTGVKAATTDVSKIRAWWGRHPDMNVGISCGPSRLVVIDCDTNKPWPLASPQPAGVNDGADALVALAEELGHLGDGAWLWDAPTVTTPSGGLHLYYLQPRGVTVRNSAGRLAPWVDVRASGGYVVAPFCSTPAGDYKPVTGWDYIVTADSDLDTVTGAELSRLSTSAFRLPDWLVDLLRVTAAPVVPTDPWEAIAHSLTRGPRSGGYGLAALRSELQNVTTAVNGQRNHTLNRAAYSLGTLVASPSAGLDELTVTTELLAAAQVAGLDADEAAATVRSGLAAGMANPRTVALVGA